MRPGDSLSALMGLFFEDGPSEVLPQSAPVGELFGRGQML